MKGLSFRTGIKISWKLYHGLGHLEFVFGRPKLHRIHGANSDVTARLGLEAVALARLPRAQA